MFISVDKKSYYFQARCYDPITNHFKGRDRVHLEDNLKNYFGMNPYLFVNNNPVRYVDPDGRDISESKQQYDTYFTTSEIELFQDLGISKLAVALEFNNAFNVANQVAQSEGWNDKEIRNGRTDAFRHTYLSANLAYKFGGDKANAIVAAYEQYATPKGFENEAVMDSFNNAKGIKLGSQFYQSDVPNANTVVSNIDFKSQIIEMVNNGDLYGFADYNKHEFGLASQQMVKTNEIK